MSVQRISSFKTFTEVKNQQASIKMHEENKAKREQLLSKIGQALEEEGVTSFDELDEEKRTALVAKIFNEDRAKDIEAAKVKMGQPKQLQSKEEGEKEEENLEEGNAFIYAAAKAKADGKSEFEFNGKTYKVTLKTDTSLKESTMIITEGTRGFFGKIDKAGNIAAVYTHYDSYPEHMLPTIKKSYKDVKSVDAVLAKGDNSGLETDIEKMNFYGGKNSAPMKGTVNNTKKFLKDASHSGAEYVYLYDEKDGKWYMNDLHKSSPELVPAFESLEVESEELNEARSINKIQGDWSKITAEMAAKAKDFKAAEGDAKAKILDELKALTSKKKALEAELDAVVADKDKDLELAVSETIEVSEGVVSIKGGRIIARKVIDKLIEMNIIPEKKTEDLIDTIATVITDAKMESVEVSESVEVNELLNPHDVLSDIMNKLQVKIGNLLFAAKGDADWTKELNNIKKAFETLEDRISIAFKKLGPIDGVMKESVEIDEALSSEQKTVETFLKKIAKEFDYSIEDAARFVKDTISKMGLKESVKIDEDGDGDGGAMFSGKGGKLVTYGKDVRTGEILVVSVKNRLHSSYATAKDFEKPEHKRFGIMTGAVPIEQFIKIFGKKPQAGMIVKPTNESIEIFEEDIKSDEEFTEYATKLLKNAFGDEFDEAKAKEVIDGILSKVDGDYGSAIGMLQSSLD